MVGFHAGAIAALFYFSWTAAGPDGLLLLDVHRPRHRHGLPPAAHAPLVSSAEGCSNTSSRCAARSRSRAARSSGWPLTASTIRTPTPTTTRTRRTHGGFWAHMGWILFGEGHHNDTALMSRYAPDLAADPFYRWLNTWHWVPLTVFGFAVLALGGWPMVLWLVFFRVDRRPARHLAGELGDAHVGPAPLRDEGRLEEQLVGRASSPSARAGTTTTTRTRPRPATASPGTSSTSPGFRSACCSCSASPTASRLVTVDGQAAQRGPKGSLDKRQFRLRHSSDVQPLPTLALLMLAS